MNKVEQQIQQTLRDHRQRGRVQIRLGWRDAQTGTPIGGGAWFGPEQREGIQARIEQVRDEYKETQPELELFIETREGNPNHA